MKPGFFNSGREKEEIVIEDEPTSMQRAEHEDDVVCWNSWTDEDCMIYDDVTHMTNVNDPIEVIFYNFYN